LDENLSDKDLEQFVTSYLKQSWKNTNPRAEQNAINNLNNNCHNNLKSLCKMVRAWKNHVGVGIGGLLIDTLCFNFIQGSDYQNKGYLYYDFLVRDFFLYMSKQNKDQTFWYAPGSNQKVYKKENFIGKAKKAHKKCLEAIENQKYKKSYQLWKEVFGKPFPSAQNMGERKTIQAIYFDDTEELIEDKFPVDIRNSVTIDCVVSQKGFRDILLSRLLRESRVNYPLHRNKSLEFKVKETDVKEPYEVYWKVKNIGRKAEEKNQIRGQILSDRGSKKRREHSSFHGPHYVECYLVKDGICVARERINVPISTQASETFTE
jgi:hypothetical protein